MSDDIQLHNSGPNQFVVPVVFASLVLIPILYYGWNSEIARWKAAKGQLLYNQGNTAEGLSILEKAAEQASHDVDLQLLLAEKLMINSRAPEAMEIIESVIPLSANPEPALRMKASCLLYLSREDEALKTLKDISDYLTPADFDQPERLNELAYFRALAGEELEAAEDNIADAINFYQVHMWWMGNFPMLLQDQTILATAMISRNLDRRDRIQELLNQRIDSNEQLLNRFVKENTEFIYRAVTDEFPGFEKSEQKIREIQQTQFSARQNLATLLTVRALILQDLGETIESDLDRQRVRLLDQDGEKILEQIPDDWTLLNLMYSGAVFLDTRAMVRHAKNPGSLEALRDLNIAVAAVELLSLTDDSEMQNTIRDDRGTRFQTIELRRSEAVIRLHRAEVLVRRGKSEEAEQDYQRVEELGFDRNGPLF